MLLTELEVRPPVFACVAVVHIFKTGIVQESLMQCMDVMSTDLFSIGADDTVLAAACRMRDANVQFLLVCNVAGDVVGTLTDRDVAVRLAAEDRIASRSVVDDIMTPEVASCRATDDVARAQELMLQQGTPRVLVTNDEGHLQGVVTLVDVIPRH